VSDGCKY